jgi:hypothetical protein
MCTDPECISILCIYYCHVSLIYVLISPGGPGYIIFSTLFIIMQHDAKHGMAYNGYWMICLKVMSACACVCVWCACMCVHACMCVRACMHVCVCVCSMRVCACMHVCVCVCLPTLGNIGVISHALLLVFNPLGDRANPLKLLANQIVHQQNWDN